MTIAVTGYSLLSRNTKASRLASQPGSQFLRVSLAKRQTLSPKILSADSPPQTVSANLQSQANNPTSASTQPLQSNTNINNPNIQSNPMIKSLSNAND